MQFTIAQKNNYTNIDSLIQSVDQMPSWVQCSSEDEKYARYKCSEAKLYTFLSENIIYPPSARKQKLQGMVVVSFVIENDGSTSSFKIIKDIGGVCGDEVIRILKKLPKLTPAIKNGVPVRIEYVLPVNFTLSKKKKKK